MPRRTDDIDPELPATEAAHIEHRDRKRTTRMVVDNAGVRRVLLDRARREDATPPPRRRRSG